MFICGTSLIGILCESLCVWGEGNQRNQLLIRQIYLAMDAGKAHYLAVIDLGWFMNEYTWSREWWMQAVLKRRWGFNDQWAGCSNNPAVSGSAAVTKPDGE